MHALSQFPKGKTAGNYLFCGYASLFEGRSAAR